jgi:hypothetical protein
MAKATKEGLEAAIEQAARSFANEVIELISHATVNELMNIGVGRSPSPGGAAAAATAGHPRRRRSWPVCGVTDCGKAYYPASGKARLCYEHFLQQGGKHPSKRR